MIDNSSNFAELHGSSKAHKEGTPLRSFVFVPEF